MKRLLFIFTRSIQVALLLFLLFVGVDYYAPLPSVKSEKFTQLVVAADGTPLRAFADQQGVWRYSVTLEDVSPRYIDTLIAYEDRWFWYHPGVNPFAILRAAKQNLSSGRVISGGSTLTMQVARLLDPHRRSITGKFKQIFRALQLEWHYSKQEILTLYLNLAPFGGPLEGVQAASFAYLGKSAKELSLAEAALLSVLPQSPTRFRPDRHPQRATLARNKVLKRLHHFGHITQQQLDDAQLEIVVPHLEAQPLLAPILAQRLKSMIPSNGILHTTIDPDLQLILEQLVKNYSRQLPPKSSAAVLVVDHHDLTVQAYVASADFQDNERFGHVDMISAIRSPGSTLKPFLYALAMDQGLITSHSLLYDKTLNFSGYRPENFSQDFLGAVSVSEALQRSLNIPAVQVLQFLGPGTFHSQLENAGLSLYLPTHSKPNLSMILGGAGVKLEQLVSAYTAFSRAGKAGRLRFTQQAPLNESYLMSAGAAWIVRQLLSEMEHRNHLSAITSHKQPLAWKTGTSYGFRDAWAVGMTKNFTIGIWTGRPDGTSVPGHYGAQTAVPLLRAVAENISNRRTTHQFSIPKKPKSVTQQSICWPDGRLESQTPETHCHKKHLAWILNETIPPTLAIDPKIETALQQIKIISIDNDEQFKLPTGLKQPLVIDLEVQGGQGGVLWFVNGQAVNKQATRSVVQYAFQQSGTYQLTAIDSMGQMDNVNLHVTL